MGSKEESKKPGSWLQKLGLVAGVAIGAGGMPEMADAGPEVALKTVKNSPEDSAAMWLEYDMRRFFDEIPFKKNEKHIVLESDPQGFTREFRKWTDSEYRMPKVSFGQNVIVKACISLTSYQQEMTGIPLSQRENITQELTGFLNPASAEPLNNEQVEKLYSSLEGFYNRLAAKIAPPLPDMPRIVPKAHPPQFLMCSPDPPKNSKPVQYKDWREKEGPTSFAQHVKRTGLWRAVKQAHEAAGAQVVVIDGHATEATSRQVYTANPVFYLPHQKTAYVPLKNAEPRQIEEQKAIVAGFVRRGITVKLVDANFNSGNMFYYAPLDTIFVGSVSSGKVVTDDDIKAIEEATSIKVTIVPMSRKEEPEWEKKMGKLFEGRRLKTPYYDLDCFFALLPNGEILYYPEGTTPEGDAMLKRLVGAEKLITISRDDAINLAANLNAVEGGDGKYTLIMPYFSKELEDRLSALDYRVVSPRTLGLPEGSFQLIDGAVHCMALPVGNDFPIDPNHLPKKDASQERPLLYHGGKRKRLEDHLTIITPDGKKEITYADLLDLQAERDRNKGRN